MRPFSVATLGLILSASLLHGGVAFAQTSDSKAEPKAPTSEKTAVDKSASEKSASAPEAERRKATRGDGLRAALRALEARRLGGAERLSIDRVRDRAREAEELAQKGQHEDAATLLYTLVESPDFESFQDDEEGRASQVLLGESLAAVGAYDSARAYLRGVLTGKSAWDPRGGSSVSPYSRRAVRRLVDIAIERRKYDEGLADVAAVPSTASPELQGESAYLRARAAESIGDSDGALKAYLTITDKSRFWAQATYLAGLTEVSRGNLKEGENLFCKVADPDRQSKSAPVFADKNFFAVRDLARLGLGRVAHEQFRFDDARYYYYLVPQDSHRLAEALYEAATTRYEKKDYDGARTLLDELKKLDVHHPYEDEARVFEAYLDLAQCKFPEADKTLKEFITKFDPVRNDIRALLADSGGIRRLMEAVRSGGDASAALGGMNPDSARVLAAIVRVDPNIRPVARGRLAVERELSQVTPTLTVLDQTRRSLAEKGGVQASLPADPDTLPADAHDAASGLHQELRDLTAAGVPESELAPIKKELEAIEKKMAPREERSSTAFSTAEPTSFDLGEILAADQKTLGSASEGLRGTLNDLLVTEEELGRDALRRADMRISRLLRRARLARVESVLGKKRALEVEIEALAAGFLPAGSLDSLNAQRFLRDDEEYWPFEGDDWPDEFVGTEKKDDVKTSAQSHGNGVRGAKK